MDRGAWWATSHGVAKGRTRLSIGAHGCLCYICLRSQPLRLRLTLVSPAGSSIHVHVQIEDWPQ